MAESSKDELEAEIARVEYELLQLRLAAAGDQAAGPTEQATEPDDDDDAGGPEPRQYVLDLVRQLTALDVASEQVLHARLHFPELVNGEQEEHLRTMQRVIAERQRSQEETDAAVLERIRRWRTQRNRLMLQIRRVLSDVFDSITNSPDHMTVQSLLNALYSRLDESPSDPYMVVADDMYPEHLAMLEAAGIISYRRTEHERYVRMRELGPPPEDVRLPEPVPEDQQAEPSEEGSDEQSNASSSASSASSS